MAVDLLQDAAGKPTATALVGGERVWTFEALDRAVDARAAELQGEGVEPGAVAARVLETDAEAVLTLLACWRIGATPAPLNPALTRAERAAATEALGGARSGAQAILWTSGTSGRPRGVEISFDALNASAAASADRLELTADDVWLASLSLAHVGGLALVTRSLLLGSQLLVAGRFDAAVADGLLGRVTHLSVVPTQLRRLLENRPGAPPDGFRCALVGGAHAPASLVERALVAGWPLALTYGLTEATSQVATASPQLTRRKPGTVGRPLEGVEVRIDETGEILVRGATLASGYVATDEALLDAHGWHHTGDLGRLDEEGDLWVTGRRADRIVTGGVTVDAAEVEEALRAHPGVLDAGVVGLPDEEWGERICAWIEPVGEAVDLAGLDAFLRERLSASKLPRAVHVGPGLPRNANGKLDRGAVRARLRRPVEPS